MVWLEQVKVNLVVCITHYNFEDTKDATLPLSLNSNFSSQSIKNEEQKALNGPSLRSTESVTPFNGPFKGRRKIPLK